LVVLAATHYEGDPCDNTKRFFKWFREQKKAVDKNLMNKVKFSVFGLGDSSYE